MTSQLYQESLRTELVKNLSYYFEDEEIKETLVKIDFFDPKLRQKILALCIFLSKMSGYLINRILKYAEEASYHLSLNEMERWLGRAFDLIDSDGLEPALTFLSKVDDSSLNSFCYPEGLALEKISSRLVTYIRGISGVDLEIIQDKDCFTDTSTIYLPPVINRFREPEKNFTIYKLMATYKWAQIACGTFSLDSSKPKPCNTSDIETLFNNFQERALSLDLYNILEAFRVESFLQKHLPGLMRQAGSVKTEIFNERPSVDGFSEKTAFVESLYQYYLKRETNGSSPESLIRALKVLHAYREKERPSSQDICSLYTIAEYLKGDYVPVNPILFLGTIKPEKVSQRLKIKKEALKKNFHGLIKKIVSTPEFEVKLKRNNRDISRQRLINREKLYLFIKGMFIELDEEMGDFFKGKGGIPGILLQGSDIGGNNYCVEMDDLIEELDEESRETQSNGIKYDEWDYKRGGYRKRWCSLFEVDVYPSSEPFVEHTLKKYDGYVNILKKKFELLRRDPKILKRQKEGENVDIDATVEAFADIRAGLPSRENLFTKLERNERNIAVLFLIDMSGSTKGWVTQAEKEACVLMCEALEALKDRYAIYGFSGITSNRCDFYRIKGFQESYSEEVKKRIAGITPKEYTRMGPPIRHATKILKSIDARIKLLITLSDGKPEDYNAHYKGCYGIEDTRKALIEAKQQGIHSFCITIDKEASSYVPYMYGEVSYLLIDDVRKLPNKITEIYRKLTT